MATAHLLKKNLLASPPVKAIQVRVAKQPTEGTVTFDMVKGADQFVGGGKGNDANLSIAEDRRPGPLLLDSNQAYLRRGGKYQGKGIKYTDFVEKVRSGYKHTALDRLAKTLGISQEQVIALLKLPRSTIKRLQSEGKAFSVEHSDRMYRAQKLIDMSVATLDDYDEAVRWLQREHPSLGGVTALSLVDTTAGYERVLDELERIAHGVPV